MPLQVELEVNVGEGKDTVVTDTIVFNAQGIISGSSELFEYSTTTNWSLYTKDGSWLTMYPANSPNPSDSVSGTPGYYPFNIVIVNGSNTGATRYGHVIIKSATKTDTIVVKQLGDITTAILNPADVPNIQAYPNPANGHITFTIEDKYLPGIVKITDM